MSEESGELRRKHKRYSISCKSRLLLPSKTIVSARLRDVSQGGVGFECLEQLSQGDIVSIEFKPLLAGEMFLIRAKGVIRFCMIKGGHSGYYYGLGISYIDKEHHQRLIQLLKHLSKL